MTATMEKLKKGDLEEKGQIVRMNIWLTRDEWRKLRVICAHKETTIQGVVAELVRKIL